MVIDNSERANPNVVRHQADRPDYGFFVDILSDQNGVNLHRFQAFVFNVLYGLIFVIQFSEGNYTAFPDFDDTILTLLGISSAGYIGLKTGENTRNGSSRSATVTVSPPSAPPPTTVTPPTTSTTTTTS